MTAPRGVSTLAVELVPIAQIVVGVRRRTKLGNLRALARSIEARGLIHPILLRGTELVAGARRLRACASLGWSKIPARSVDRMTDEELRAIELDENTERLGLVDYETSRQRLAEIRQAEADLKAEFRGESPRNPRGGRPKEAGSRRDVEAVTGVSPKAQRETERHVAIAGQYPIFQHPSWPQYRTLEAGEVLATLPEAAREGACALIETAGAPPEQAIAIFRNLAAMPEARRTQILTAAMSDDRHVVSRAVTDAAQLPPVPDEGLTALNEAVHLVRVAAKMTRFRAYRQRVLDLIPPMDDLAKALRAEEEADRADPNELS